jgi:hypothetical protein
VTKLSLQKTISPGTWRFIGQRLRDVDLSQIPIAGTNVQSIHQAVGGDVCALGGTAADNAILVERPPLRLVYVRPLYTGYRKIGLQVFPHCRWKVDFDHALGRKMAEQLGYGYVLLLRVSPSINRGHGSFERNAAEQAVSPTVCFADARIRDKWIGRGPNFWRKRGVQQGFDPGDPGRHGLTLKQKGWWGFAMGIEDETIPLSFVRKIVSSD